MFHWSDNQRSPHSSLLARSPAPASSLKRAHLSTKTDFPGEHLLAMFYLRDPWVFQEKLEHFNELEVGSAAYERFLAWRQIESLLSAGFAARTACDILAHFRLRFTSNF